MRKSAPERIAIVGGGFSIAVPELRAQAKRAAETLLEQPPVPVSETEVMMEYMI